MSSQPPRPIGWPLLSVPDANGELHYPTLEASVRQCIQVILRTRPGEQLMRPAFGGGLENFLHEPNTLTSRQRIHDAIADSLALWEKRIVVDRIEVNEMPEQPSQIRVEIAYRLLRTGVPQHLGVTMTLEN
jgi:phage baseplate assembly protein W